MGRKVTFSFPPQRIISLVPSQTELLYDLGLDEKIVGQTLFCIHPHEAWLKKPRVGGTKKISFEKIAAIEPDLIIGNKEENDKQQIEQLALHFPVWMSDIRSLDEALEMIAAVGEITDKGEEAGMLVEKIRQAFKGLDSAIISKRKAAYFIWRDPWMAAGGDTFINNLMHHCGFTNVFEQAGRYPRVDTAEIRNAAPELILLSSEPYPFKEAHIHELKEVCPHATVTLVDGEMLSWYGSRLLKAVPYLKKFLESISQTAG